MIVKVTLTGDNTKDANNTVLWGVYCFHCLILFIQI